MAASSPPTSCSRWRLSLVLSCGAGLFGCEDSSSGASAERGDADRFDATHLDTGRHDTGIRDGGTTWNVGDADGGRTLDRPDVAQDCGCVDADLRLDQQPPAPRVVDCAAFDTQVPLVDAGPTHCDPHAAEGRVTLYDNPSAINAFRSCGPTEALARAVYLGFAIPAEMAAEVVATGGDNLAVRIEDFAADVDVLFRSVGGDVFAECRDRPMVSEILASGAGGVLGWFYPRHSAEQGLFAWFSMVYLDADGGVLQSVTGQVFAR